MRTYVPPVLSHPACGAVSRQETKTVSPWPDTGGEPGDEGSWQTQSPGAGREQGGSGRKKRKKKTEKHPPSPDPAPSQRVAPFPTVAELSVRPAHVGSEASYGEPEDVPQALDPTRPEASLLCESEDLNARERGVFYLTAWLRRPSASAASPLASSRRLF